MQSRNIKLFKQRYTAPVRSLLVPPAAARWRRNYEYARSIFRRICETDANTNQRAATRENKHINNVEHKIMQGRVSAALVARKLPDVIAEASVSASDLAIFEITWKDAVDEC